MKQFPIAAHIVTHERGQSLHLDLEAAQQAAQRMRGTVGDLYAAADVWHVIREMEADARMDALHIAALKAELMALRAQKGGA